MLLRTKEQRFRTRVSEVNQAKGEIGFSIHPKVRGTGISLIADFKMVRGDLDYTTLKVGEPFDALVVRFLETTGQIKNGTLELKKDQHGDVIVHHAMAGIEKPQIHPFDIETLYPKGLTCLTATVNNAARDPDDFVIARINKASQALDKNGVIKSSVEYVVITRDTKTWQAQAQETEEVRQFKERVFMGLTPNASLNLWIRPDAKETVVIPEIFSVNYK